MTDNDIIKALECCIESDCDNCPWHEQTACNEYMKQDALDLINRQKAEIEELNELYTNLTNASVQHCIDNEKDRQLLGEYQNIFLELGYSTEAFDPELTEIKAWKDRMIWNCKKSNEMHTEIQNLKQRIKNANEHEIHIMKALKTTKVEAVKEVVERLKEHREIVGYDRDLELDIYGSHIRIAIDEFDNLVKEMVGEG